MPADVSIMAPASNPAKGLQQNRPRPTVPRTIIPAIPLPYVQKRKQQEAARAKAREEASAAAVVEAPTSPEPKLPDESPLIVNGFEDQDSEKVEEPSEPAVASTPATPAAPTALPVEEAEVEENNAVVEGEVSSHEESQGEQTSPPLLHHFKSIANLIRRTPTGDTNLSSF